MSKKILSIFVLVLTLSFSTQAFASLTLTSNAITGTTASSIDLGAGNDLSLQTSSGNVGIGTITPANKLSVSGNVDFSGLLALGGAVVDTTKYLNLVITSSDISGPLYGVNSNVTRSGVANYYTYGGSFTGNYTGAGASSSVIHGTGNYAYNNSGNSLTGKLLGVYSNTNTTTTSSSTNEMAFYGSVWNQGTLTNGYGLYIDNLVHSGATTNSYGVYINTLYGTNTYGLYQSDSGNKNYLAGSVGIGTTSPSQKLEVNGGVRLNTVTAKPTCDASVRGTFWTVQGGTGVADTVEACIKNGADTYVWQTLY